MPKSRSAGTLATLLRERHKRGCAALVLVAGLIGCFPAGRATDLPESLQPQGSVLAFFHLPSVGETRIIGREDLGSSEFEFGTVLPEGDPVQVAFFEYTCPSLRQLGVELDASNGEVRLAKPELALRAPDRIIEAELRLNEAADWREADFEALRPSLKSAIESRLPALPGFDRPFLSAPPCGPHPVTQVPLATVEAMTRPRFAIPLEEDRALVGLGNGKLVEIDAEGGARVLWDDPANVFEGAYLARDGRLWLIRFVGQDRQLESIRLEDLRAGRTAFDRGPAPPEVIRNIRGDKLSCSGVRELSLDGPSDDSSFELFLQTGDGFFARFDGSTWTSTNTLDVDDPCPRKNPHVVWQGPGRAVASHALGDRLVFFELNRGFREAARPLPRPPTSILEVPDLGLVVGTDRFQMGVYSESEGFEMLPGSTVFANAVFEELLEALVLAPGGFFAAGDGGRLVRFFSRREGETPVSSFCVVNERRDDEQVVDLPHISLAARAGDGLVLVPRELATTSFAVNLARVGDQNCQPALQP